MAIFVHLASVWVPFTSEAKEAVAHYPELLREITLALQECGRRLAQSLRARAKAESEAKRKSLFERYIPELGQSLGKITGQNREAIEKFFLKALPNFVNFTAPLPEPPESGGGPNGATPADADGSATRSVVESRQPKKRKGKTTKKAHETLPKKGEQLRLIE